MLKIISILIITLFLSACNQVNSDSTKTITNGNDTVGDLDISLSKLDVVEELAKIDEPKNNKLLFRANGNEPGWFIEFYETKLRIVVDYGKDSVLIDNEFKSLDDTKGFVFSKVISSNNKTTSINIALENKPCTFDGSGDKGDRTVLFELNKKKYKGCGSFVK